MKTLTGVLLVLMLTGCAVHYSQMEEAQKLCATNDGVEWVTPSPRTVRVVCKNGATFDSVTRKSP